MSGLAGANLRLDQPDAAPLSPTDIIIDSDPGADTPDFDDKGNVLRINFADGSVELNINGAPLNESEAKKSRGWFDNLADDIAHDVLTGIASDLLRDIEFDLQSRQEWIEDQALGVKLLGLKIELPNTQGAADGAPVEGMSRVRHPLLLEAVLRFQANARSEFLPTDGPVKIRNDSTTPSTQQDQLANALEQDMNHYLTAVATEYYPDTDRMLFRAGFCGMGIKKVYTCPLRGRPVSESIDADDLIVNQSATDLANAKRVTHRIMMRGPVVKRMQIIGAYRDIDLGTAVAPTPDALQMAEKEQQGITDDSMQRPEDRERQIYEVYCDLNIPGFEHRYKSKDTGLEIPYIVTIDVSSREVLSVVRNYDEDTKDLPVARKRFVKFPFVPGGGGFYEIGLLHILGNSTNAITAAWREMLDNGMYANFPGFLMQDIGGRQNTNIFRVPPGGGAPVKTGGVPIKESIMPLPYSSAHMPALMQLVENMAETGRRIGGTAEVQVGEGRADVPVGTVMAMIDQAIKVMNAVHKRMHAAQAEEFQLLKREFREHPETFWQRGCRSKTPWDTAKFLAALNDCNLVPQADPNTSSSGQRMMKVVALMQLSQQAPTLYDPIKVHTAALASIGWPNPEEFFVPPQARAAPPPQLIQAQQEMQNQAKDADAKLLTAQAKAQEAQGRAAESKAKVDLGHFAPKHEGGLAGNAPEPESLLDVAKAQATVLDAQTRARELALRARDAHIEDTNRDQDRHDKLLESGLDIAREFAHSETGKLDANAGTKATKIIDQVDRGIDKGVGSQE